MGKTSERNEHQDLHWEVQEAMFDELDQLKPSGKTPSEMPALVAYGAHLGIVIAVDGHEISFEKYGTSVSIPTRDVLRYRSEIGRLSKKRWAQQVRPRIEARKAELATRDAS